MSSEGSALKRCCFICCIAVMLLLICLIPFADVNRGSPDAEHDEAISEPMVAAATETADTRDKRAVKLSLKVAHEATDARDKAVVAQEAAVAAGMVAVDRAPLQEIDLNELGPPEQKAPQTTDATAPLTGAVKQNGPEEVPVDEVVEEPSEQQIADAVAAAAEKAADQSDRAAAAAAAAASPVALAANVAAKREKPAEQAPLTPAAQVMPAAEAAPAAPPAERAVEPAAEPPAEKSAEPATAPEKAAKRPAGAAETAAAPVEKAAELAAAPAEKAAEPAAPVPVTPHSSQKASELAIAPTGSATAAVAEKAAEQAAATPAAEKAVHHPGAASVASKKDAQNGPPIYFLQFEGPPGLNRTEDGKWSIKSPVFCLSLLTAAYHKVDLHIIGPGRVLQDQKAGKGPALLQYISKIPDGSLVIFYDAQDVFVLHNTAAILEVARGFDLTDTIVFGAERNCWEYANCSTYPEAPTSYRFVNSGALLAKNGPHFRGFIEAWVKCIMEGIDDQNCVHLFYHKHPQGDRYRTGTSFNIVLDHHCKLFQSGWGSKLEGGPKDNRSYALDGDRPWVDNHVLTNPETNTQPCFVHFNGGKQYMGWYHELLFPEMSWTNPRIKTAQFMVWGHKTEAPELCQR